jgi:transposase-like protein
MQDELIEPVAIENLIKSVRRDGFKRYHDSAKAELITQARSGRYSIAKLARVNGVNANLLHRWIETVEATPRQVHKKLASNKTKPRVLLPVIVTESAPNKTNSPVPMCEIILPKGTLRVPLVYGELAKLIALLSA